MRNLSKRERALLYLTIIVFIAIVLFNFVVSPALVKLTALNQDIEKKEYLLKKYTALTSRGEDIASVYDKYKDTFDNKEDSQQIIDSLFKEVKEQARLVKLDLQKIKPLPVEQNKGYNQALLEVELRGGFPAIFKFINQMEDSSSFIKIFSFRLVSQGKKDQGIRCNVTVSRIFF